MNKMPPRYIINPMAITDPIWIPELHQVVRCQNKSYLNSLWLGACWNILSMPQTVFKLILKPLFSFEFFNAAAGLIIVPAAAIGILVEGVLGRITAIDLTTEQVQDSIVLDKKTGMEALEEGCDLVVLDMMMLLAQERGMLPEGHIIPGHPRQSSMTASTI